METDNKDIFYIDLNAIGKACADELYSDIKFDDVDELVNNNVSDLLEYVNSLKENASYDEFKISSIETLKTILRILYIKKININEFINISLNYNDI